jgi:hypothetical protein
MNDGTTLSVPDAPDGFPVPVARERFEEFSPGLDPALLELVQATADMELAVTPGRRHRRLRLRRRRGRQGQGQAHLMPAATVAVTVVYLAGAAGLAVLAVTLVRLAAARGARRGAAPWS